MNSFRLILRNLFFFRAASLALVAGMAVAAAVLCGALLVGDSVRGSLQALAVQRLGPTDEALVATRFVTDSLAQRLASDKTIAGQFDIVPGVIVTGGAAAGQGDARQRTSDVQIAALGGDWAPVAAHAAILNSETAAALGNPPGGQPVLFTFPSMEDAPRDATVARREEADAVARLPVTDARVTRERGMLSLFNLQGGQRVPRNAWVNLQELQEAVGQSGRANVLLVHNKLDRAKQDQVEAVSRTGAAAASALNVALQHAATLDDYGLSVKSDGDESVLSARATYLPPAIVATADRVAREMGISPRKVTVNLVNEVVTAPSGGGATSTLHYAIAAGISSLDDAPLAPGEVVLNAATAEQMNAKVGDTIHLVYWHRQANGELREVNSADAGLTFKVSKILPMPDRSGGSLAADPSLTPQYKGLTDAGSVADWHPPAELKIDEKIATRDEDAYWRKYKASPRLFVSIDAAEKMWGGPYGDITSIRIPTAKAGEFSRRLRDAIDPAMLGLAFRPIRAQQLAAASSGTDFAELFVSFSFFVIVAAALLVAMLFRLNIEQRARQLGLLSAVGFAPRKLRRLALAEGMTLATIGAVIGVALGIGYTWLLVYGLRTWWVGAVGTTALSLYVAPLTLVYGFVGSLVVAFFAILWGVWRVGRAAPARLLAGAWGSTSARKTRSGRITRAIGIALFAIGLLLLVLVIVHVIRDAETALSAGALLLCGGLVWLAGQLRPHRHASADLSSVRALGVRNASRHTARSVLSVGLIAFAAFTLVIVAAMRRQGVDDTGDRASGAGGYRLIVQAGVPLLGDLNTPDGRQILGITDRDDPLWQKAHFTLLRRWAGQDISCLNLTRPNSPTILAIPQSLIDAKPQRFTFASTTAKADNPWTLLDNQPSADTVPVIADDETAQYILHLPLGGTMTITDQTGQPRTLKLVATLANSIFQSEMLMSEANFRRLFPTQAGFGTVLVDVPNAADVQGVQQLLNRELEPYAVSVDTTAARLEGYKQIANTYLSTFQVLGALGLALGTIGLAVVLVRNVIERRAELALLAALGFRRGDRVRLVLSENVFLLLLGLGTGTICAMLGVVPTVLSTRGGIGWLSLGLTLLSVLVVGLLASTAAVWISGMNATPADLRSE